MLFVNTFSLRQCAAKLLQTLLHTYKVTENNHNMSHRFHAEYSVEALTFLQHLIYFSLHSPPTMGERSTPTSDTLHFSCELR